MDDRIKVGVDMDGVYAAGFRPDKPHVIISGRTTDEFWQTVQQTGGRVAIYLRTKGQYGNGQLAGEHKASLVKAFGIEEFYEDDTNQAKMIKEANPDCKVFNVQNGVLKGEWTWE